MARIGLGLSRLSSDYVGLISPQPKVNLWARGAVN